MCEKREKWITKIQEHHMVYLILLHQYPLYLGTHSSRNYSMNKNSQFPTTITYDYNILHHQIMAYKDTQSTAKLPFRH